MATKLWDQEIDKTIDWGNADGLGTPVSGKYVQKFIKDTLAKKFGYLYYDRTALKYYVFADEADYLAYSEDSITNEGLILATFDAPAPADIQIISNSAYNVTTLLSATNRKISFNYYIIDKSSNAVAENVSLRIIIARSGEQQSFTDIIGIDRENYNKPEIGTHYEFSLDKYLTNEGTYTITITLTGLNTQASTTLTFLYTVVNLELSVDSFEYYKPFKRSDAIFNIPISSVGAEKIWKNIDIYVDGVELNQQGLGYNEAISSGDELTSNKTWSGYIKLYNKKFKNDAAAADEFVTWGTTEDIPFNLRGKEIFTPGKHTLQLRTSIPGDDSERFYSKTKYIEFVVIDDAESDVNKTYLLYVTDVDAGTVFDSGSPISLEGQQYDGVALNIAVIDNQNRTVPVIYEITGTTTSFNASIEKFIDNETIDNFTYRFDNADTYNLRVYVNTASFITDEESLNEISAVIKINPFKLEGEDIKEALTTTIKAKYTAINRGNGETNKDVWTNSATNDFGRQNPLPVTFNNVLWNEQSGWDGEALVLKNGATIELPINLFGDDQGETWWSNSLGLTFEIDFETFDVQDDDAIIMDYSDPAEGNKSSIVIKATEASITSQRGIFLKTNFKDGTRNKIAFSFNPTTTVQANGTADENALRNPNLMMIYVNGVLDRAGRWGNGTANSDEVIWTANTVKTIKIGNTDGAAGVKIYSIRILDVAYEPEEAFMNYVVDQGKNIPDIISKNHVRAGGSIDLDLVKRMIPTLVLYTDYTKINGRKNKKDNVVFDGQFYDPTNPELNFYVRNGWLSCQGTSSMNYPTKNLRPYFNKTNTDKTLPYDIATAGSSIASNLEIPSFETVTFNTEFWPVSEYAGNEESVATYIDNEGILPYAVNKKLITKDKFFANAYHEIGMNLAKSYRIGLAQKYAAKGEDIFYLNGERSVTQKDGSVKQVDKYDIITPEEDGMNVAQQIENLVKTKNTKLYISAYRKLRRTGWELGDDNYWKYLKQLRYSGVAIYEKKTATDEAGVVGADYKKAEALDKNKEYYGLGAYWRQYDEPQHYSGWTDRWTLKADYAESSMTHNAGVARVWGNALRNFKFDGQACGLTLSQSCSSDPLFIDIRTSCDGKPIVLFVKNPIGYDENTGQVLWSPAEYAGLFNIMTDKSSTALFGFEDIKDENNNLIWDASAAQCWEFLQNGSLLATGNSLVFDDVNETTYQTAGTPDDYGLPIGEGRPIFTDFEPRWPESGEAKHEKDIRWYQDDVFGTESNSFETFWNWLYFTKPAVKYEVSNGEAGGWSDGYDLNPYQPFENTAKAAEYRTRTGKPVYLQWNNSGNIAYAKEGTDYKDNGEDKTFIFNPSVEGLPLYWLNESIDYETVRKTINPDRIRDSWNNSDIYKVSIYGFDALNHCRNNEGALIEDEANKYMVDVYMWRTGNRYYYNDCYGNKGVEYKGLGDQVGPDDYEVASDGVPFANKTYIEYFSATKWDHLDVYKVAAYYIYILRFGAADQVVKNCMMTTEDGQHWYFINYDNDTTLGVRNDAQLVFKWDFDRDTYDASGNSYAFAGAKSVLWNNLSMDNEFMNIVKSIDSFMYSSGLLSVKTVLEYLDEKQMNTWCERLYNEQEQIKYLSTFKRNFNDDRFLLFLQGTRQSHRNWWVNHRWELYDAMWSTGSYSMKQIKYYLIVNDASADAPQDTLTITAASKYYFTVQKNNNTIKDGFKELKAGETATFYTNTNQAIGDPMTFIGPQKLKVLNFRPSAKYITGIFSLNEAYEVTESDGITKKTTNWVEEAGTMMSKLLVGDGINTVGINSITGMNTIISLEEIDLRKCSGLTSSPSVNKLNNLHRFRAEGSAVTIFESASGCLFYEISLPAAMQRISLDKVTFKRQPVDDYVAYADGDKLPYTETINEETGEITLGGSYNNDDAYRYTEETKAIFNVKPTKSLNYVSFNDVSGLDTYKFVMDWKESILDAGISPSTCTLNLTKINWTGVKVSELIEFVYGKAWDAENEQYYDVPKFNITNFTGIVNVISDDPETNGDTITLPEYNRIIEFFGESVFNTSNALVITTGENIFYQPTTDTKTKQYTFGTSTIDSVMNNIITQSHASGAYEVIRGNVFKAKATKFPADGKTYKYVLSGWNANGNLLPITHNGSTYTYALGGITLNTDANGNAVLTATDNDALSNYNYGFAITYAEFVDGEPVLPTSYQYDPKNNIYVMIVNKFIPDQGNINIYIDNVSTQSVEIKDTATHTIKLDLGAQTNAEVLSVTPSFATAAHSNNIIIDEHFRRDGQFLEIDLHAVMPQSRISNSMITFAIEFDTAQSTKKTRTISTYITVTPVYADTITITDVKNDTIANDSTYNINKTGSYTFNITLSSSTGNDVNINLNDYKIDINNHIGGMYATRINISDITENTEGEGYIFTVTVTNNELNSFTIGDIITLNFYNEFDTEHQNPLQLSFDLIASVIYPENISICIQNYNGNIEEYIKTGSDSNTVDIYLINNQGTYPDSVSNTTYKKLIPGSQDYIGIKLIPDKVRIYDALVATEVWKEPTQVYSLNIIGDLTVTGDTGSASIITTKNSPEVDEYNNEIGVTSFNLKIPAIKDHAGLVTVTGKYEISYDKDWDNNMNTNGVSEQVTFTVNIHYSVASANTYNKLSPAVENECSGFYLVDEDSNYYEVPNDLAWTTGHHSDAIDIANSSGVRFIGFGQKYPNNRVSFVYLRSTGEFKPYANFLPNGTCTLGSLQRFYYYETGVDSFFGYTSTEYWVNDNEISGNTTGLKQLPEWQSCGFKTMWDALEAKHDGTDKVELYVPSYSEFETLFGSDYTFINKYDNVVNYLKQLPQFNADYSNLITLNSEKLTGLTGTGNLDPNHIYFWYLTSSTALSMGTHVVIVGELEGESGSASSLTNGRYAAAAKPAVTHVDNNVSVLPFIKVS